MFKILGESIDPAYPINTQFIVGVPFPATIEPFPVSPDDVEFVSSSTQDNQTLGIGVASVIAEAVVQNVTVGSPKSERLYLVKEEILMNGTTVVPAFNSATLPPNLLAEGDDFKVKRIRSMVVGKRPTIEMTELDQPQGNIKVSSVVASKILNQISAGTKVNTGISRVAVFTTGPEENLVIRSTDIQVIIGTELTELDLALKVKKFGSSWVTLFAKRVTEDFEDFIPSNFSLAPLTDVKFEAVLLVAGDVTIRVTAEMDNRS